MSANPHISPDPRTDNGSTDSTATPFLSDILKPGSSFHPTFLLFLDMIFFALLLTLLGLVFVSAGNIHLIALTAIALALWASVKWFVYELRSTPLNATETSQDSKKKL